MSDYSMSRRGFLAAAGTAAAGTAAGCIGSEHERYDISEVEESGLAALEGEKLELTGYAELQEDAPAYIQRELQDGTTDMIEPVGIYNLYDTPEEEPSEYGVPIVHNHAKYHLGSARDNREYRVQGTVMKYFLDENAEEEAFGLYLEKAHEA